VAPPAARTEPTRGRRRQAGVLLTLEEDADERQLGQGLLVGETPQGVVTGVCDPADVHLVVHRSDGFGHQAEARIRGYGEEQSVPFAEQEEVVGDHPEPFAGKAAEQLRARGVSWPHERKDSFRGGDRAGLEHG